MNEVFVLLDDCHATAAAPTSRLYRGFAREHRCTDPRQLDTLWRAVVADQRSGLHAAVFADYEWGAKLQGAGLQHLQTDDGSALRVLMFQTLQRLSEQEVAEWLAAQDGSATPSPAGVCDIATSIDNERFDADIARIRELISQGETYQVNYTLRLRGSAIGSPLGLYRRLRARQPVAFAALAALPAPAGSQEALHWVLSSSPELFVRHDQGLLTTRPMKGTAARLSDPQADKERAAWLAQDPKNRAENVMIVDLLRNDLGRISEFGTVSVPHLFAVETYKTVHQMTSTVQSTLRAGLDFPEVLRALFPCGSITGAPKIHTMDWIAKLEDGPRGLYCGAIGWVDASHGSQACGDFCLSVAIRTLVLGAPEHGRRPAVLGVGGGIVLDSEAGDEFAETQAKARYLTAMDPGFTLFETLRISRGKPRHLAWHLRRLQASAQALGFRFDAATVQAALAAELQPLDAGKTYRLRLDLHHGGQVQAKHAAIERLGPARLLLAASPVPEQESALLRHKTSLRTAYDAAIHKAQALGAFDAIFANAQGEITEGARSTLFIQLDGHWYTPPLASGVLAGVLRTRLLARYADLTEKVLTLEDLERAQALAVGSALRGLQRAQWLRDPNGEVLRA